MFAQLAITVLIIAVIIGIGYILIIRPYKRESKLQEIDIERIEAKKRKLHEMKEEILSTKEEIDVTEEMNRIEKELQECERELNRLEKKRGKRKKPQKETS